MHPRCCRPLAWQPRFQATGRQYCGCTTSCNTQSSAHEVGRNYRPKHVELIGIINKSLLLHLVGCIYYLNQWCRSNKYQILHIVSLQFHGFCIALLLFLHFNILSDEVCYIQAWYHYLQLSLAARMFIKLKSCIISLILGVFRRHSLFKPRHFGMHSTMWKSLCRGTRHTGFLCNPTRLKTEVGPTFET
jgi:hypothetical protein